LSSHLYNSHQSKLKFDHVSGAHAVATKTTINNKKPTHNGQIAHCMTWVHECRVCYGIHKINNEKNNPKMANVTQRLMSGLLTNPSNMHNTGMATKLMKM
jgi:cytochrome c2